MRSHTLKSVRRTKVSVPDRLFKENLPAQMWADLVKSTDFEKGDYGWVKRPSCSPFFNRCYRKRDYAELLLSDHSPFSLCLSGKKSERRQRRHKKGTTNKVKGIAVVPFSQNSGGAAFQHTMDTGGKAQSAPFCLLSARCRGAEGKSRAGGGLRSEENKSLERYEK